ncbi:hypothetical protein EYC84_011937 [Monilinia fructicola]|uniref:Uncharacterized protein n=1 Tax=Monilinia fructicola TaxID=38448 RepID=A0A5M9J4T3_MONFR|nr:hypothetical protein EYC84_011937 [Monilinia fructicola]
MSNIDHEAQWVAERAQWDTHLRDLMQAVSKSPSLDQIKEFQTYMEKAKKESPQKGNPFVSTPDLYANHPAAFPPIDLPSKFLSVPQEIRLEIYRYLLLPTEFVSIEPGYPKESHSDGTDDSSSNDSWTDEDSISFDGDNSDMEIAYDGPDGIDGLGTLLWSIVEQQGLREQAEADPEFPSNPEAESILDEASQTPLPDATEIVNLEDGGRARRMTGGKWETESDDSEMENYRMFPEILRVNKQIHQEASSVLFAEGTVVINVNDMLFLTNKKLQYGMPYGDNPWRYDPLTSVAKRLPGGTIQYNTPPNLHGRMEPHIFAKFQKVLFDCTLEDDHTEDLRFYLDVNTWKLDREQVVEFRQYLRSLTLVKDFVKLLSKSHVINKLTINVLVEITAGTKLDAMSIKSDDEEAKDELDAIQDRADMEANCRATEIFMDENMFKPLKYLKNVRKLEFGYGFEDYIPPIKYVPDQVYQDMVRDMKVLVAKNFKEPEEPTREGLRSQAGMAETRVFG